MEISTLENLITFDLNKILWLLRLENEQTKTHPIEGFTYKQYTLICYHKDSGTCLEVTIYNQFNDYIFKLLDKNKEANFSTANVLSIIDNYSQLKK